MMTNKTKPVDAPTEKKIIFCISLYFGLPKKFSRQNIYFKMYLKQIAEKRNFLETIADKRETKLFENYLNSRDTKRQISLFHYKSTTQGVYRINRNLKKLVFEIMQDLENNLLQVQEYKKPPTQRELTKKINSYCAKNGINKKLPLRKKSFAEKKREFEAKKKQLDQQLSTK